MSLLVWLPLHDGNLTNYGSSPAKFEIKNSSGALSAGTTGKTGSACYQRTVIGRSDHISSDINFTLDGDFSMACWCKVTEVANTSTANGIITNHDHTSGGAGITLKVTNATTCYMSCNTGTDSNNRTYMSYYGTTNIFGAWHHLCLTYNRSEQQYKLYVDGVCEKTVEFGDTPLPRPFSLFAWSTEHLGNGSYRPACQLNDVRLYDECLSTKEVRLLSQGLVLHYKLNANNANNMLTNSYTVGGKATSVDSTFGFPVCSADNSTGTGYKDFASWGNFPVTVDEVYTVSFYARSNTSSRLTMYFYNNTSGVVQVKSIKPSEGSERSSTDGSCPFDLTPLWKKYTVTWTFKSEGTDTNKTLLFRLAAGGTCEIALPKLERGAIATPYCPALGETNFNLASDSSGYQRHGTVTGSPAISSDARRYSTSCVFDGSTTGINLPIKDLMKTLLKEKCTVSFWVKEANTGSRSIYFGGFSGSNFNIEQTNTNFRVYWNGSPDLTVGGVVANEWIMWTVTTDISSGIKIYKNDSLVKTHAAALTDITANFTRDFNIGKDSRTDSTMMEGKMSDFRIYASALTADDIKDLYQTAISMTKNGTTQAYEFSEGPDSFHIQMEKKGVLKSSDVSEVGYIGGMKVKTLSDGSAWARIHWLDVTTDKTVFTGAEDVAFCNESNRFSRMGLIDHFRRKALPAGYTRLDYIASTGTQYIDTNYYWTAENVSVYMDATVTSNDSNQSLFGNEEKYTGGDRYFGIIPHGKSGSFALYVGTGSIGTVSLPVGTRTTLECSTTTDKTFTAKVNGTAVLSKTYSGTMMAYANTSSTNEHRGKIFIFSNHNSSSGASPIQNVGGMKLYAFKMYDNNKIVRDFIPCKNASGVVGLYDKVYNTFYSSPNGTAFEAGSILPQDDEGCFEFMLTYPRLSATDFNRWTQYSSANENVASGFQAITTAWPQKSGGGLKLSKGNAIYNAGNTTSSNWYGAIGQTVIWTNSGIDGIPGANGKPQTETELWVRIDNLVEKLDKTSMLNDEYIQAFKIYEL